MDLVADELQALVATSPSAAAEARVLSLCEQGLLRSDAARCAAAEILSRSQATAVVRRALDLATAAMATAPAAKSVAACCHDRLRMLAGLPQKFGTQRGPDGALWPVDPATTDSERSKWGLPPLRALEGGRGGSS